MNNDIIKGRWRQLTGRIKRQWGRLTEDDLAVVEGTRDYLSGRIQERYGLARDAAERQVREFERQI